MRQFASVVASLAILKARAQTDDGLGFGANCSVSTSLTYLDREIRATTNLHQLSEHRNALYTGSMLLTGFCYEFSYADVLGYR